MDAEISMGIYAKTSKRPVALEQKSLTVVRVGIETGLFQVGQSAKGLEAIVPQATSPERFVCKH